MTKPSLFTVLKKCDAYPKVQEDFFTRTFSGGIITIIASTFMIFLFFSELRLFLTLQTRNELIVDVSRGEQLSINLDITFPRMPCSWLSLDAMDVSGELHLDVAHSIYRRRLSPTGVPLSEEGEKHHVGPLKVDNATDPQPECGSCYGAEDHDGQCCNTCDEVREAYRRKGWAAKNVQGFVQCVLEGLHDDIKEQTGEGCHIWGSMMVNKVAGNFHFAPGKSFQQGNMHVHDLLPFNTEEFDMSHNLTRLSFGESLPGVVNPLDGVDVDQRSDPISMGQTGMFQYFLKVVPSIYTDIDNNTISSNQFSVTENFKPSKTHSGGHNLPGVFFFYDLSPIKVVFTEFRSSFFHFLTSVCAIVGGVFTVSGLVDSLIYHGEKIVRKKIELGKIS